MVITVWFMWAHLVSPNGQVQDLVNYQQYKTKAECEMSMEEQKALLPELPDGTVIELLCIESKTEDRSA